MERNKKLDGLRGSAILLIILWHYGNNLLYNNTSYIAKCIKTATSYCWSGVDLFFVLSGFLLGSILLRNKNSKNYFKTFYIRRVCRIFPVYYLSLILIIFIVYKGFAQTPEWSNVNSLPTWSYLSFTQNIFMGIKATLGNRYLSHTWSLALEEQFYLILPLLIYFLNTPWLLRTLIIAIVVSPVFRYYSNNWFEAFNYLHCRFDALFTGVVCAYLFETEKTKNILIKKRKIVGVIFLLFVLIICLMTAKKIIVPYHFENSIFAFTYSLLLLLLLTNSNELLSKLFSNSILTKTGFISFGLYLFHQPVNGIVHFIFFKAPPQIQTLNELAATVLSFIISFSLAGLSYYYFERRFILLGHKNTY